MPRYQASKEQKKMSPPATTMEGRENQMIALAMDLAEKRLRAGTATAQEVTHFLKLGSVNSRVERDILEKQKELLAVKTDSIRSARRVDELYAEAISAMKEYAGGGEDRNYDDR